MIHDFCHCGVMCVMTAIFPMLLLFEYISVIERKMLDVRCCGACTVKVDYSECNFACLFLCFLALFACFVIFIS